MAVAPWLVVPGVHRLAFEPGQAYLWEWGEGLTVVDTGSAGSAGAILDAVAALGRRPADVKEILLTHFHDDHRGGRRRAGRAHGGDGGRPPRGRAGDPGRPAGTPARPHGVRARPRRAGGPRGAPGRAGGRRPPG